MRTLVHISDLHFSDVTASLTEALAADLHEQNPDLLIVSGDLTQRARRRQFALATAYLARLPGRKLVVPGNHDIPLFDVVRRFMMPLERYRQYVCADLQPAHIDDELAILGISTARPITWWWDGFWRDGRVSDEQAHAARMFFAGIPPHLFRILVTHHPFSVPPRHPRRRIVHNARAMLAAIAQAGGVDLLLAGHLHTPYWCQLLAAGGPSTRPTVCALAGTAISTRVRREPNCYNVITVNAADFAIATRTWTGARFEQTAQQQFARTVAATVRT